MACLSPSQHTEAECRRLFNNLSSRVNCAKAPNARTGATARGHLPQTACGVDWNGMKKHPASPAHPDRVCWGCNRDRPAEALWCGNGTIRTPHPSELFGEDWLEWVATRQSGPVADATVREELWLDVTSRLDILSERSRCAIWNSKRTELRDIVGDHSNHHQPVDRRTESDSSSNGCSHDWETGRSARIGHAHQ